MDYRKRVLPETGFNGIGGFKKPKQEIDSISAGVGSKSKPCNKFFSIVGCPFGEGCHFLHYVPGGYNSVSQMMLMTPTATPSLAAPLSNGALKTRLCNKFNTAEGCKFGEKCRFAHGERELGKKPSSPLETKAPTTFGASATAKISVDAALAGPIIGKSGVNSKQICRLTGAKLLIREHETDAGLRNVELEGSFEQIKEASSMVRELILSLGPAGNAKVGGGGGVGGLASNNLKTKICDNFTKGSCTFGEKCHFAHGAAELRKLGL